MPISLEEANSALVNYYRSQIKKQLAEAKTIQALHDTYKRFSTKQCDQSNQSNQANRMMLNALFSDEAQDCFNTTKAILQIITTISEYEHRLNDYTSSKINNEHNRSLSNLKQFRERYLIDLDKPTLDSNHHKCLTRALKVQYKLNPKFCATVDKLYVLNKLKTALQEEEKSPTQRLNTFRHLLNNPNNVKTLTRRRDTGFVTFIKGIAVALGGTLLLAPGYLAYKKLFSRSNTKGADLINNLRTQTPNTINAAPTARP